MDVELFDIEVKNKGIEKVVKLKILGNVIFTLHVKFRNLF